MSNSRRHSNSRRASIEMSSHVSVDNDEGEGISNGRRTSSRSSASASPAPLNGYKRRNSSASITDFLTSRNGQTNGHSSSSPQPTPPSSSSSSSTGAIPLTKNVGVSVNFGKSIVKSNSSSSTGSQHVHPNGQQHQQQHTPGASRSSSSPLPLQSNGRSDNNNNSNNNGGNSAAINLGHGHIGTIFGPPSVSISSSSGSGAGGVDGVNHNSSTSTSPAVNAPTTCANKGVPLTSTEGNQKQHLPIQNPEREQEQQQQQQQSHSTQMSPHSPNALVNGGDGAPESGSVSEDDCKNGGNSSSTSASSTRKDGTSSNNKCSNGGVQTGPISPTSSISSSTSRDTKGDSKANDVVPSKTGTGADGSDEGNGNAAKGSSTNRIVSQNVNGTLAITGVPKNESELQLFRVLQRANLLSYFDVMIELGGDDVQQLCDAGKEEFLEIMALVGMASKPLHVRRLQKALQEWMTQPGLFQAPVLPPGYPNGGDPQLQHVLPQLAVAVAAASSISNTSAMGPLPLMSPFSPLAGGLPMLHPGAIPTPVPTPPFLDLKGNNTTTSSKILNQSQANTRESSPSSGNSITNSFSPALQDPSGGAAAPPLVVPSHLAAMLTHLGANNGSVSNNQSQQQQHQSRYSHHHRHLHHHLTNNDNQPHSNGHHPSNKNNQSGPNPIMGIEKGSNGNGSFQLSSSLSSEVKIPADQIIPSHFLETRIRTGSEASSSPVPSPFPDSPHPEARNSVSPSPSSLQEHEVQKLADTAIRLLRSLPPSVAEPKFTSKRKTSGDYELILRLSESDPRRMEEVRRIAAVYGRADAKRRTFKPLSMHELAINEAAAQLCKHVPALLTKRDELLSLSRQLLRESGLPYAAVSSTFSISIPTNNLLSNNSRNSISVNNNDINTKSKYEEINGINRQQQQHASPLLHFPKEGSSPTENHPPYFNAFHAKRLRSDGASAGIEIQEYNGNDRRSHSVHGSSHGHSPSPPSNSNGMQITEIRNLPLRRSPSADDDHHLPTPLELVTVTSDLRKTRSGKSSSVESSSPPSRRPVSVGSDDLNNGTSSYNGSNLHQIRGMRTSHQVTHPPSLVKTANHPVNGGSISLMNHNGMTMGSCDSRLYNHHFANYQYNNNGSHHHGGLKFMPIKSEPSLN